MSLRSRGLPPTRPGQRIAGQPDQEVVDYDPPAKTDCSECNGTGWAPQWVSFQELADWIRNEVCPLDREELDAIARLVSE